MRRFALLSLCALVVTAGAGCGTAADRDQARVVAQRLYAAAAAHDGAGACAQMSPSLRQALVKDEQKGCSKAVLDLDLSGRTPTTVEVYATSARVRFAGGDTVFLGDTAQGWRVEALGCRPAGKGPYDCEADA